MKFKELKKIYPYDQGKKAFILDVQLEDYRDAYSSWDFSPFTNRDLDDDLTEYLLECSYEIPMKYKMVIDFHNLNQLQDRKREERSIKGMQNYFNYQLRKLKNQKVRVLRDMVTFMVIGSILLLGRFYFTEIMTDAALFSILSEGLLIGGWVMIWEMFSAWFFDMKKVNHKMKHFRRLHEAEITYSYRKEKEHEPNP